MKNLSAIKLFASLSLVVFSVGACAADAEEPTDETTQDGEEVGSAESDLTGVGACKSDAYWRAHANRVCGGHANIDWRTAVRTYRRGYETKRCGNGAVSVSWTC